MAVNAVRWQGQDGGRMVSVTLSVGRSSVTGALASSSVEPGYSGTPVSQIHVKVKGVCPRAGPQCEFPTLMTFIRAARWMDTSDQRKPLEKGTWYPAGMVGGEYCGPHRISSAWGALRFSGHTL